MKTFILILSSALLSGGPLIAGPTEEINALLEPIRAKHQLPALAGAVITHDGLIAKGTVGVRKAGTKVEATTDDLWHLGSDTKAMTATLAGTFVAEGKLAWTDTVTKHFPEFAARIDPKLREVTVMDLLSHRAGLIPNLPWQDCGQRNLIKARSEAARRLLTDPPASPVGEYTYSNAGYVVVGSILEKLGGKPWEELLRERVFTPLDIRLAGFGGTGTEGKIDQPWPHFESGKPTGSNGPDVDNRPVIGPAGTVHMPLLGWSKFLTDQLRGGAGAKALLPAEIYDTIQSAHPAAGTYGLGWVIARRPWAGGKVVMHSGSNTMNYAVCWLAVPNKFGILICTNQGGDAAEKASDEAVAVLMSWHAKNAEKKE